MILTIDQTPEVPRRMMFQTRTIKINKQNKRIKLMILGPKRIPAAAMVATCGRRTRVKGEGGVGVRVDRRMGGEAHYHKVGMRQCKLLFNRQGVLTISTALP